MAEVAAIFLVQADGTLDIRHSPCAEGEQHPVKICANGQPVPIQAYGKLLFGQWAVHTYCGVGVSEDFAQRWLSDAYCRGLPPFVQRDN